jgi:hypothetical protein
MPGQPLRVDHSWMDHRYLPEIEFRTPYWISISIHCTEIRPSRTTDNLSARMQA